MKYLITGGAGFIGSHLAEAFLERGHAVTVLDNLSTGSLDNLSAVHTHPSLHFVEGDAACACTLEPLVAEADRVYHLAAAVGVELVVHDPTHTITTNVHGTEAVLKAAAGHGKRVYIASTSEVYGRSEAPQFRETDDLIIGPPTHSRWCYALSKLLDEFLTFAYAQQAELDAWVLRFFNTVGPRQTGRYGMVLPRFVEAALENRPIRVFGDGRQSRCFCHVADTVRALLALDALNAEESTERIFNVGSTHEVTIYRLAETVRRVCESSSQIVLVPYAEAYAPGFDDMRRRAPDTSLVQRRTGWSTRHDLEDIIRSVRDYCRETADLRTPQNGGTAGGGGVTAA